LELAPSEHRLRRLNAIGCLLKATRPEAVAGCVPIFDHSARTAETNLPIDPSGSSVRAGFDPGVRNGSLLLNFCRRIPRVILLVFALVSAAIDDKSGFKFKWL